MKPLTIEIYDGQDVKLPEHDNKAIWIAIKQLREGQMATQQEIDAITTEVQQVATDLQTASGALQTEISNLANANPSIDLTGLRTAVQPLDRAVQALGQLQPLNAEPAPAPAPEPAPEVPVTPEVPPVAEQPVAEG